MLGVRDAGIETRDRVHRADGKFERLREVLCGIMEAVVGPKVNSLRVSQDSLRSRRVRNGNRERKKL
jgi:hypothetical protein